MAGSCYRCRYLQKKPGRGSYFIFTCTFWGLQTRGIIPHSVVISAIGKACPYFHTPASPGPAHNPPDKDDQGEKGGNGKLDIII